MGGDEESSMSPNVNGGLHRYLGHPKQKNQREGLRIYE